MKLHTFMVHFPIATWILGSLMLAVGTIGKWIQAKTVGLWMLYMGALCAIPAALTGQTDIQGHKTLSTTLTQHQNWGNLMPWLMGTWVLLHLHTTFAKKGPRPPDWLFSPLAMVVTGLLIYTAYLGGQIWHGKGA